nr:sigma 54-interacting transcriptional regulator [Deltaproteobacteria bacterium]
MTTSTFDDTADKNTHEFKEEVRKRGLAEQALKESEIRYRTLFESAGDAIFIMKNHKFIACNKKTLEMYGCTEQQIIGSSPFDHSPERQPDGLMSSKKGPAIMRAAEEDIPQFFEWRHKKCDGTLFEAEVSINRMVLSGEIFLLAIVRDVTKRKQAEQKLQEAFIEIKDLKDRLQQENVYLREEIELRYKHGDIVGKSDAIKNILTQVEQVAKTDSTVLIQGETGTGKELIARAIHSLSLRKDRPMVKVNCASLPSSLVENELFGHEKGAFTGANVKQIGRFEVADESTIFLDEVSEMPLKLQAKLLRVLQEGQFERLGSTRTISVDVRVIAATNQDLAKAVQQGAFREDLYYRLNVFPIAVPPLRERREDIPLMVQAFVKEFEITLGKRIESISRRSMDAVQQYSWPGNVRELRNVIERAMILTRGSKLSFALPEISLPKPLDDTGLAEMEKKHILRVLDSTGWLVSGKRGAAHFLGLKESTLRSKMKKLEIKRQRK